MVSNQPLENLKQYKGLLFYWKAQDKMVVVDQGVPPTNTVKTVLGQFGQEVEAWYALVTVIDILDGKRYRIFINELEIIQAPVIKEDYTMPKCLINYITGNMTTDNKIDRINKIKEAHSRRKKSKSGIKFTTKQPSNEITIEDWLNEAMKKLQKEEDE